MIKLFSDGKKEFFRIVYRDFQTGEAVDLYFLGLLSECYNFIHQIHDNESDEFIDGSFAVGIFNKNQQVGIYEIYYENLYFTEAD